MDFEIEKLELINLQALQIEKTCILIRFCKSCKTSKKKALTKFEDLHNASTERWIYNCLFTALGNQVKVKK
jgi:hypothetical protein